MDQRISRIGLEPVDAIEPLVFTIGRAEADMMAAVCISGDGLLGPCEFYPRFRVKEPPLEMWFSLAGMWEAAAVMFACRAEGPIATLAENDLLLTHKLIDFGKEVDIPVFDVLFIEDRMCRVMSQTLDNWSELVQAVGAMRSL